MSSPVGRPTSSSSSRRSTHRPCRPSPGYVRVDLLRAADSVGRYVMQMRWQDPDAATGWRTSPVHTGLQPALNELVTTGGIEVYAVVR